ncbi:tripartite tricarboxylate transporter TctB family protein [Nesterenkonia ebinurensis]|uniref:tripartite tricarboxylate transporter TctB family protein n=1 Tax=Nesterenkonia ebinurensis TaxID=2608252 RepID=UPI00123C8E81|nr:tripartite tricarboxylate transporter TctB family protein [Nesterenkonia ebinurensis]
MKLTLSGRRVSIEPLVWLGIGVAAFAAVFAGVPSSTATALQTPRFWPAAAAIIMIIAGLIISLSALRHRQQPAPEAGGQPFSSAQESHELDSEVLRKHNHLLLIVIIAGYVAVLPYLGYVVATLVMAWVLAWTIGVRKVLSATLASITYVALTTVIFGVLMNVPLPRGRGPFVDISAFFF